MCVYLLWPDPQMEVEASLQKEILDVVWVDAEVEVQRVPQELVRLLIPLTATHTAEYGQDTHTHTV